MAAAASQEDTVNERMIFSASCEPILMSERKIETIHVVHRALSGRNESDSPNCHHVSAVM